MPLPSSVQINKFLYLVLQENVEAGNPYSSSTLRAIGLTASEDLRPLEHVALLGQDKMSAGQQRQLPHTLQALAHLLDQASGLPSQALKQRPPVQIRAFLLADA